MKLAPVCSTIRPRTDYDSAGDLTQDGTGTGSYTYTWDGEGRMATSTPSGGSATTYIYNALGQRVDKYTGTSYHEYIFDPSGTEAMASSRGSGWFTHEYLYLGGKRFGKYANNHTYFLHMDKIGSVATATDETGSVSQGQDVIYQPWGQQWAVVGSLVDQRFASLHLRDTETNLDPTHFRMFSSDKGRWMSPDPKAGCGMNPQNHNRYAYVRGSPLILVDPRGDQED